MIKLICPECRRENEPERIYCHDCGARLDRTALGKVVPKDESPEQAHRRVKAIFSPQGARIRAAFFKTSKVILGALLTAVVIEMILPPDLPNEPKSIGLSTMIGIELEEAARTHSATPLRYSEEQVNLYLANALKTKQSSLNGLMQFDRALVKFDENLCTLSVARSLYGYSFYSTGLFHVAVQNGTLVADCKGGRVGRLPIHPELMKLSGFLFRSVGGAFDRERKSLAKMNAIEFHPQLVAITP